MKLRLSCLLALVLVLFAACSPRDELPIGAETPAASPSATAGPTGQATPGISPEASPEPLPAGLQRVLEDVAEVRGLGPPPSLKASLVARSALPALLDSLLTDDDRELFADTTTLYRLIGHFRDDQDYLGIYQSFGADSILGLYSPLDDELWVVYPDGERPDFDNLPKDQAGTLAHELAHAIQDYHFQLDVVYETVAHDLDRSQVFTSVVEGDAVDTENRYADAYLALPLAGRLYAVGIVPQASDVPVTFIRELLFPYTAGANWITNLRRSEGQGFIDGLLADPPAATAYVLHPDLLLDGWEPVPVTLPDLAAALGEGWGRESGGVLGEFHLGNYLQLQLGLGDSADAAAGWAGDHYDVYRNGAESAAIFRIEFASTAEAEEFASFHRRFVERAGGSLSSVAGYSLATLKTGKSIAIGSPGGSSVTFVYGSSPAIAARAIEALFADQAE